MRKLLLTLSFALAAAASAADVTVIPTTGSGADDLKISDTTKVSVQQKVTLNLPLRTALHLDVTDLVFDLNAKNLGGSGTDMVCVHGNVSVDQETRDTTGQYFNQLQVKPNGIAYKIPDDGGWKAGNPKIVLTGVKNIATQYPPATLDAKGELVPGSKNNFVCFKTFILQKFSNVGNFKLSVTRDDPGASPLGHQKLYIQDNSCLTIFEGAGTGFFALPTGSTRELLPLKYTVGTTGHQASSCGQDEKSWLDDLIVVAVKINGDPAGKNVATLTYTLDSRASAFTAADGTSAGAESY